MNLLKREIVQMLFSHLKKKEKKIIIYSLSSEWMLFKVIYPELRKQIPPSSAKIWGGIMQMNIVLICPIM